MKLAVLMSTYNGEKYLREQIDSIIHQKTDIDMDLIVRDDGSSDSTKKILEEYACSGKLSYTEGENVGPAKGFLTLLRDHPGYDFYAFSDQDDVWHEDKIQNGINAIQDIKGPALYCTNGELVDSELRSIGVNVHRKKPTNTLESSLCLAFIAQGCTSVFNKELARMIQENPLPKTMIMHDTFMTCLCGLIGGKVIYDDVPSMKYRMHGGNCCGEVYARQDVKSILRDRIDEIFKRKNISAYAQAESILETYKEFIPEKNRRLCEVVISSKNNLLSRFKLVFNKNLRNHTLSGTISKKLEILFGKD